MLFADKTWNYLLEPLRPKNIEFLYVLMHNEAFNKGQYDTSFFDRFQYLLTGE